MTKSFVLYTVFEVEGELVDCIYLANGQCRAQPIVVGVSSSGDYYNPTDAEKKEFCSDGAKFKYCPRFVAYLTHLKAIGLD